jgi:hypothetical protein
MFMRRTGKREFAGRASKRGAAPNGVEIRRNDSASPTKATFARDGKKHRLLEFVVPPLGGRFDGFRLKGGTTNKELSLRSWMSAASVLALGEAPASGLPIKRHLAVL